MLFKKNYVLFFVFLIVFSGNFQSSRGSQEQALSSGKVNKNTEIKYRMVEHLQTIKDKESPAGEWEIRISYPELYGAIKEAVKTKINNAIAELANAYKCTNNREYSFVSEVMYIDRRLLSLRYDMLWFCNGMSYSSTSDSVTWDLNTGDKVVLESEFFTNEAKNKLYDDVVNKIKKEMKDEDKKECPALEEFSYYYKKKKSLVFVVQVEQRLYSWCNMEIKYPLIEMKKYLKPSSILLRE